MPQTLSKEASGYGKAPASPRLTCDLAPRDRLRVALGRLGDHLRRVVHAGHEPVGGALRDQLDGHAAAAAHVEDVVGGPDVHQVDDPDGQGLVLHGHDVAEHVAEPPGRLAEVGLHQLERLEDLLTDEGTEAHGPSPLT